jgi:hypothetical protein
MICRFGWSIGSGLFQFELILLKIPLADWGSHYVAAFLQAACIALTGHRLQGRLLPLESARGKSRSLADC